MPIPILIGGLVVSALYGAKKGYDAKCDFDVAKECNSKASEIQDNAQENFKKAKEEIRVSLEKLGRVKFDIYIELEKAITILEHFKKIEVEGFMIHADHSSFEKEMLNFKKYKSEIKDIVNIGVTALGTGGLLGLAAYGTVGVLATSSTGAAIAGLSGVAATNATLAWLGGGSLAVGGGGIALGTTLFGGIITLPAFAVGAHMLASKAESEKNDAYSKLEDAKLRNEEIKTEIIIMKGIEQKVEELASIIDQLNQHLNQYIKKLHNLKNENRQPHYTWIEKLLMFIFSIKIQKAVVYSLEERKIIYHAYELMVLLKGLLEQQVINDDGSLTDTLEIKLNETKQRMNINS